MLSKYVKFIWTKFSCLFSTLSQFIHLTWSIYGENWIWAKKKIYFLKKKIQYNTFYAIFALFIVHYEFNSIKTLASKVRMSIEYTLARFFWCRLTYFNRFLWHFVLTYIFTQSSYCVLYSFLLSLHTISKIISK